MPTCVFSAIVRSNGKTISRKIIVIWPTFTLAFTKMDIYRSFERVAQVLSEYAPHCALWVPVVEISPKIGCFLCFHIFNEPLGRLWWFWVQNTWNCIFHKSGSDFAPFIDTQLSRVQKTEKTVNFRCFLTPLTQTTDIFQNVIPYWSCLTKYLPMKKIFIKIGQPVLELFVNAEMVITVYVQHWSESVGFCRT